MSKRCIIFERTRSWCRSNVSEMLLMSGYMWETCIVIICINWWNQCMLDCIMPWVNLFSMIFLLQFVQNKVRRGDFWPYWSVGFFSKGIIAGKSAYVCSVVSFSSFCFGFLTVSHWEVVAVCAWTCKVGRNGVLLICWDIVLILFLCGFAITAEKRRKLRKPG